MITRVGNTLAGESCYNCKVVGDCFCKKQAYGYAVYENKLGWAGQLLPADEYLRTIGEPITTYIATPVPKLTEAIKYDDGKLRYDLIPPEGMEALAEVFTIGAKKYADRNWELGMNWGKVFRALMSHAWKWFRGERYDKEDGQLHMASVAWCAFVLLAYESRNIGTDDRVKVSSVLKEVK